MMLETELRPISGPIHNSTENVVPVSKSVPTPAPARRVLADVETATLLTNAKLLLKAGERELALNLLREASNRDSKNPLVLEPLAEALETGGHENEALKVREVLAKVDYQFTNVYGLAHLLYRLNRDQEALHMYFEALSILTDEHPVLFEIHKNMGNIFVRQGDFEGAEEKYNQAYRLQPDSDTLMVNFGTLEVQRGDFGRSLTCFRRAVELNAKNDKAWTGLAMVHNEMGDQELAWGNLERALDLNPGNRTAVHLAANWATRDRQPLLAITRVENYLETVESDEDMSLVLVNLFCGAGHLDLAELETEKILAWNPDQKEVRQMRSRLSQARSA
jgi:tetratricopeptide (TPR) repeat protein